MAFTPGSRYTWASGRLLLLAAAVLILPTIAPAMLQRFVDRFVYFPMRYPDGDWNTQRRANAEDVWFTSKDGLQLNAW